MTNAPKETVAELESKLRIAKASGYGRQFLMTAERVELLASTSAEDRRRILALYAAAIAR